jgi:multisubunit Na+/H+ antiporter MnhB subunit
MGVLKNNGKKEETKTGSGPEGFGATKEPLEEVGFMKKNWLGMAMGLGLILVPGIALAAGGGATEIVVVADTRHLSGFSLYIATLYNENLWLFATWSVIITTAMGAGLGLLMDAIMKRTGLDLGKTHKSES